MKMVKSIKMTTSLTDIHGNVYNFGDIIVVNKENSSLLGEFIAGNMAVVVEFEEVEPKKAPRKKAE